MNRSILIVICDFLVLAALSLSMGVSEETSSVGTGMSKPVSVLADRLLKTSSENDALKKGAEAARNEAKKQAEQIIWLEQQLAELKKTKDFQTAKTAEQLRDAERTIVKIQTDLAERNKKIQTAEAALKEVRSSASKQKKELDATSKELTQVSGSLKLTEGRLKITEQGLEDTRSLLKDMQSELRKERDAADAAKEKYNKAQVELAQLKATLSGTEKRLQTATASLVQTNANLAKTQKELVTSKVQLVQTKERLMSTEQKIQLQNQTLSETRKQLQTAERALRSDALTAYSGGVLKLDFRLKNDRLMNSFDLQETYYLPQIKLGDKSFLVSEFRLLTGLRVHSSGYTKVADLIYRFGLPEKPASGIFSGPILLLSQEPRVCLMENKAKTGTPLPVISFNALKKRGLANLTLFKPDSFGKKTTELGGRCSLSLSASTSHLYVRNSLRNSSELAAVPGDFILTKEGQLAGLVIQTVRIDSSREEAICFVFPDASEPKNSLILPIRKISGSAFYTEFSNVLQKQMQIARERDQKGMSEIR